MGSVVLLPLIAFRNAKDRKNGITVSPEQKKTDRKQLVYGGLACGTALCFGNNLQQEAFRYLEAGKVGFITALYMVLVPILGLFLGKKVGLRIWFGVALAVTGLYLLCVGDSGFALDKGTVITLLCAVAFAVHILCLDRFTKTVDPIKLSSAQFFVAAFFSTFLMIFFNHPTWAAIKSAAIPLLYTGIMSSGVAFTFQTLGQKYTEPTVASLLLCLESAFSLLFGWMILHEFIGVKGLIGCGIMLIAVIITQIQPVKKSTSQEG